jgi:hypothetical protein
MLMTAETVDPTSFLNDVLGSLINSPILLLSVPIVAALTIASLIAYGIISYANPAAEDD